MTETHFVAIRVARDLERRNSDFGIIVDLRARSERRVRQMFLKAG